MGFSFGGFTDICQTAALVVCPLLNDGTSSGISGISPTCYSRNVELVHTIIFQPATCFMHIVALIMLAIMSWTVRTKYTAVGRKEIIVFFYLYGAVELLAIFLDSGIIPTSSNTYPWFAAVYVGLICATFWSLAVNAFVGFQFAEDGTPLSLWFLRLSTLAIWGLTFFIAIATFKSIAGFSPTKTLGLWIMLFVFNAVCVLVYIVLQLVLVIRTLDDRWPIGDIIFGTAFFTVALVIQFGFSVTICDAVKHYLDGLFFSTLCNLLAVMMVYKYWDSITKEDLEFSVGSKQSVWEVKTGYEEDLGPSAHGAGGYGTAYGGSSYPPAKTAW